MTFRRSMLLTAALIGSAALAGCDAGTKSEENVAAQASQQSPEPLPDTTQPTEMPAMIARSASYRCDDGDALYVSILTKENMVNVRDTRLDVPTRLLREDDTGPFAAEGRTLSGTGDVVRYSAPDRPEQECRAAPD